MARDSLEKAQSVVSMISLVAVPLTIGLVGWNVQQTIANQTLRKDYADMALRVLAQSADKKQDDLRLWAVAVVDKYAPVPLSAAARKQLLAGAFQYNHQVKLAVPESFMKPPEPSLPIPKAFRSEMELNNFVSETWRRGAEARLTLKSLQEFVRGYQEVQRDFEDDLQKIDRESAANRPTE
jgi:hypothetical protein